MQVSGLCMCNFAGQRSPGCRSGVLAACGCGRMAARVSMAWQLWQAATQRCGLSPLTLPSRWCTSVAMPVQR
jgi:hypothetical protein